ncbi:MAG: helix-turn-helix domain-containing protein [Candidatus Omnitrophica bacterium]|nr:helix-turn-helix domain-containing protein [Candidatus Omnitrophota bacterium]MCF7892520.1 helix-turn-helix domain-containing protein [Candidatus Omnitrophota bacterium]MCF7895685.1 helix-turn-helix domain-containing protein [Candidatus Omnitrophota bacterium]MCF7898025.1 helix-turn-helix domain-containing protein [Candidatus Omnitrophota bacterium]
MEERLVDIKKLSQYLGVKEGTIYSWVNQEKIPYVKINRLVRFNLKMINEWIDNNSVESHSIY